MYNSKFCSTNYLSIMVTITEEDRETYQFQTDDASSETESQPFEFYSPIIIPNLMGKRIPAVVCRLMNASFDNWEHPLFLVPNDQNKYPPPDQRHPTIGDVFETDDDTIRDHLAFYIGERAKGCKNPHVEYLMQFEANNSELPTERHSAYLYSPESFFGNQGGSPFVEDSGFQNLHLLNFQFSHGESNVNVYSLINDYADPDSDPDASYETAPEATSSQLQGKSQENESEGSVEPVSYTEVLYQYLRYYESWKHFKQRYRR